MDHDIKTTLMVIAALIIILGGLAFFLRDAAHVNGQNGARSDAYSTSTPSQAHGSNQTSNGTSTKPMNTASSTIPDNITAATITTNKGVMEITFASNTPVTVENFAKLAAGGFYNGTRFHRVIHDFMIQGGDPLSKDTSQKARWGTGGPGYTFKDETSPSDVFVQGVVAMANAGPNTNGSQFFIVTSKAGTPWLAGKHTIFGHVTKGFDVALQIQNMQVDGADRPLQDVIVESITIR